MALAFAFALPLGPVLAQCGPVISTFPYTEGFESGQAWTSGGSGNDWAWGTPAHPMINSAGGGTKSWCTGGLSGSFYNLGELAWLESPCFDFSTLARPWISFKIFWECERQYDGMTFQYSLDGGNTYSNLGAYGDPVDCLNQNWFNSSNITNLTGVSPKHGWSGRVGVTQGSCQGGSGSGGWQTASHCMSDLAFEPSVRFRFLFGAGTTCNNFDGIAIDDILIQDSELPVSDFTYSCSDGAIALQDVSTGCVTSRVWDFGDPGSGASNNSTLSQPTHVFSQPGTYTVTLTVHNSCVQGQSSTQDVVVIDADMNTTDATCGQSNGSAGIITNGAPPNVGYVWSPGGQITASIQGLSPGEYSVVVSAQGVCTYHDTAQVNNVASDLVLAPHHTDASCAGGADGTASVTVTGSATPFSYAWTPAVSLTGSAANLAAGDYDVQVTDANDCIASETITVSEPQPVVVSTTSEVSACPGATTELTATATGGTGPYTFSWTPDGPQVSPTDTTTYQVSALDAHGCVSSTGEVTVAVGSALHPTLSLADTSGCAPFCATFQAGPAGLTTYGFTYGDGSADDLGAHCYTQAGDHDVTLLVTDANGCSGSVTVLDLVTVLPKPHAGFTAPEVMIITDPPVTLVDASTGAQEWEWDLGNGLTSEEVSPTFRPTALGCVPITQVARNDDGCVDTAHAVICVEDEFALYAPNTFTPNDDGINDVFGVVTSVAAPSYFVLRIFDRWGEAIFSADRPWITWNGEGVASGVYPWTLEIRDSRSKLHKQRGHVLLLR